MERGRVWRGSEEIEKGLNSLVQVVPLLTVVS